MRTIAIIVLVLFGFCYANNETRAQKSDACKQCNDQRKACMSNYAGRTCKSEYDICMKHCRQK